jgi:23S rRNA (cytidine1920-2'-O)/16S rRNA (cytidine1409-2'-O)-methyltransferase
VLVDGRVLSNPAARVRLDSSLRVLPARRLRGEIKLSYALDALAIPVADRVAVDVGASAGGFTTALLHRRARRIYAVDVGVGQLLGHLRIDERIINLEGLNLAGLDNHVVPEPVELITVDLSYLALADALPQLEQLTIADNADLVALVKPTFELHRSRLAATDEDLTHATAIAGQAAQRAGWHVRGVSNAPATGRRGALEVFVHARRSG